MTSERPTLIRFADDVTDRHRIVESVLGRGIMVCAADECHGRTFAGCDAMRLAIAIQALYERAPKTMLRLIEAVEADQ